ncbi:MAG: CapA family protein [Dehalococcoidia bacterium]|nr:CapA family protein [Dehalococcoidia bacterium]MDW8119075.1 CapA family protein [Chloroflexota bacterium]
MLFEAEGRDFAFAATGDAMITRPLRVHREDRFLGLVNLLRSADAAFTNLEMLFHDYEGSPGFQTGTYTRSDPANLEELKWMGFQMVSCANNHAFDYGEVGLLTTREHLRRVGLVAAGTGRNLAEARAPAYLETPKGRVALLSVTSTFPEHARAGDQRPDMQGRPGVSALGYQAIYTVDREAMAHLRRISQALGFEEEKEYQRQFGFTGNIPQDTDTDFHFLGRKFRVGQGFAVHTLPQDGDVQDILRWVRDARRMADWVVMSLHSHESGATRDEPAEFVRTFARLCIDNGVDIFVGHGPHFLRGIEIYKGKPIFYSLGNFIFQNDTVYKLPQDAYTRFGLGYDATPADFFEARTAGDTRGFPANPVYWETVVAVTHFRAGRLEEVRLYPCELGVGRPRSQRGRPLLASPEAGARCLERLARLCQPLGTDLRLVDGVGIVRP